MGDSAAAAGGPAVLSSSHDDSGSLSEAPKQNAPHQHRMPFHSQFDVLHSQQPHQQSQHQQHHSTQYTSNPYNMATMTGALPQAGPPQMPSRSAYEPDPSIVSSGGARQIHHPNMFRGMSLDPNAVRAAQQQAQQQYMLQQFAGDTAHPSMQQRQPPGSGPSQDQFQPMMHPYGVGGLPYPPMPFTPPTGTHIVGPLNPDIVNNPDIRRASEPAPVPSFPRGPPRKPKQSGHALWVGNLPPAATVTDLKDHFSRDATKDIESLFLISKSNCAFVNYRTEAACVAAMNRFHDSRFHGVRLVCRLRRGSSSTAIAPPADDSPAAQPSPETLVTTKSNPSNDDPSSPVIVGQPKQDSPAKETASPVSSGPPVIDGARVPDKYFIVKSLTVQDLEASVRNGIWATQSHNEATLNKAYEQADNVYLIFSANKSGEYFGYARMASAISGEPVNLSSITETEEAKQTGTPQSIPTPATETAPKGRIIDDSARGTIFWEAEHSDLEDGDAPSKDDSGGGSSQNWGRQFQIEWMSTGRLPFFRTRGLRNPWNSNREVKIARDGTELEPSVGRRLVQMFHRQPPSGATAPSTAVPSYR